MSRFTIRTSENLRKVQRGESTTDIEVLIDTTGTDSTFVGKLITLSVVNLPFETTFSYSPQSVSLTSSEPTIAPESSLLSLTTDINTPPGVYTLTLEATYSLGTDYEVNTTEFVIQVTSVLELGVGVSRVLQFEDRNFSHVVYQMGNPPLDSEENLAQDIQATLLSKYVKSQSASGWLSFSSYGTSLQRLDANRFFSQSIDQEQVVDYQVQLFEETPVELPDQNIILDTISVTDLAGNPLVRNTSSDSTQPNGDYNIEVDVLTGKVYISRIAPTPVGNICIGRVCSGDVVLVSYSKYHLDACKELALVNGWVLEIRGTNNTDQVNVIELSDPDSRGSREDVVYLEVWRALVDETEITYLPSAGNLYPYGNVLSSEEVLPAEIVDPQANRETTKRVQIQYAIRTFSGVNSSDFTDGLGDTRILSKGPNANFTEFPFENTGPLTGDYGLWGAECPETVDNFCWAIPMAIVHRRNTTEYSLDNPNGSSVKLIDGIGTDGSIVTASDRPDGLYSDQIHEYDIFDRRRQVTHFSADELLQNTANALYSNNLRTTLGVSQTTTGQRKTAGTTLVQVDKYGTGSALPSPAKLVSAFDGVRRVFSYGIENFVNYHTFNVPKDTEELTLELRVSDIFPAPPSGSVFHPDLENYLFAFQSDLDNGVDNDISLDVIGLGTDVLTITITNFPVDRPKADKDSDSDSTLVVMATVILAPVKKAISQTPISILEAKDQDNKFVLTGILEDSTTSVQGPVRCTLSTDDSLDIYSLTVPKPTFSPEIDSGVAIYTYYIQGAGVTSNVYTVPTFLKSPTDSKVDIVFSHPRRVIVDGSSVEMRSIVRDDTTNTFTITIPVAVATTSVVGVELVVESDTVFVSRPTRGVGPFYRTKTTTLTSTGTSTLTFTSTSGEPVFGFTRKYDDFKGFKNYVFVETSVGSAKYTAYEVSISRKRLDAFVLTVLSSTGSAITVGSGLRIKGSLLSQITPASSQSLTLTYFYVPNQCIDLPSSITVDLLHQQQTIDVSNIGFGGGELGYPYETPLIHIPVNHDTLQDQDLSNFETIRLMGQNVETGFLRTGFMVPANFSRRIHLYSKGVDSLGRPFYKNAATVISGNKIPSKDDLVVFGPDLAEAINHKSMYFSVARVVEASDSKLIPGELVMLVFTSTTDGVDIMAGVSNQSSTFCVGVVRLPGNPTTLAFEKMRRF